MCFVEYCLCIVEYCLCIVEYCLCIGEYFGVSVLISSLMVDGNEFDMSLANAFSGMLGRSVTIEAFRLRIYDDSVQVVRQNCRHSPAYGRQENSWRFRPQLVN